MINRLLGIKINQVDIIEASHIIADWIKLNEQNYVVTPNVEIIMASQRDKHFTKVLNNAGLSIPDSARLGWGLSIQSESNLAFRLLKWPFFLLPGLLKGNNFPVTTGTDLMENLLRLSADKGYRVGFLGGKNSVAIKLAECLKNKFPKLMIQFVQENIIVDFEGNHTFKKTQDILDNDKKSLVSSDNEADFFINLNSSKLDLLFVAFGHIKQEKWINKNLKRTNVKVMIGVGGAFDYLSGTVHRAPLWLRSIGMEWIYRLMLQPWRIIRFGSLVEFIFAVLFRKSEKAFVNN